MKERSVRFYADKMFITPKYLSQIVKDASGIHIQQWIDDMVIMAIKALLKELKYDYLTDIGRDEFSKFFLFLAPTLKRELA
jgi:hypothetical protein